MSIVEKHLKRNQEADSDAAKIKSIAMFLFGTGITGLAVIRRRRQNFQSAVDLHGIGINNHTGDTLGHIDRERRFSTRRRPGN